MINLTSNFAGADFDYQNGPCRAAGTFRRNGSTIESVTINGIYEKSGTQHNFWANLDAQGKVSTNGTPKELIGDIADAIADIITAVETLVLEES